MGAGIAVLGFVIGGSLVERGAFAWLAFWFTQPAFLIPEAASLPALIGVSTASMIATGVGLIAVLLWVLPKPSVAPGIWSWHQTGLALAALGTAAWIAGFPAGWHWGLSMVGPSRTLFSALLDQSAGSMTWGVFMLLGVPLGSFLNAHSGGTAYWQAPKAPEVPRRFLGGLLMGFGGTVAAGCNIGNALTGLSVFSVNSLLATIAIVLGLATAVRVQEFRRQD